MRNIALILLISCLISSFDLSNSKGIFNRQKRYPFDDYAEYLGYPVETHEIQTSDGYILTYFRLQAQNTEIVSGKPVVYFQHGLLDSSDSSILNDEYRAPGLMLANAGYDVWFGNSRGNKHSLKHIQYTTKQKEFWDFSMQDMALKDLPAAFEYIFNITKEKINYVGHSQGTLIMFMALAEGVPSVVSLLGQYIALGPVAYVGTINSGPMKLLSRQKWLFPFYDFLGIHTFGESNQFLSFDTSIICRLFPFICKASLQSLMDADPKIDNLKRMGYYMWHEPAGTSIKNMKHWMQLHDSDRCQKFDYGKQQNLKVYGTEIPPAFNLSNIKTNVHLMAGDTDLLADPIDVVRIYNEIKDSSINATLRMYHMGHATFLIGQDMSFMNDVFQILKD